MRTLLLGATVAALVGGAAQAEGPYVSGAGGASFLDSIRNAGSGIDIESRNNTGFALSGAVGYGFANGFRLEGEVAYRRRPHRLLSGAPPRGAPRRHRAWPLSTLDKPRARPSFPGRRSRFAPRREAWPRSRRSAASSSR
jgi:hypothetical protein